MKRCTLIAMFAAAVLFAGCKKKDDAGNKPAVGKAVAGDPADPKAAVPAGGDTKAAVPPAGDPNAAVPPAGDTKPTAPGGNEVPPAGEPPAGGAVADEAGPSDEEIDAKIPQLTAAFDALGDAVAKNADNCGNMATALEAAIVTNTESLKLARKWSSSDKVEAKMTANGTKERMAEKMKPLEKCMADPKILGVMQKMMSI